MERKARPLPRVEEPDIFLQLLDFGAWKQAQPILPNGHLNHDIPLLTF
jgi:hypothetical protein